MITVEQSSYEKRSDLISSCLIALHFFFAFLPVGIAASLGPGWHTFILFIWYGVGLNSILNLMHECAHYHIFKNKQKCEWLGRWIFGGITLSDFDRYRERHWVHHRKLGTDEDTKYVYLTNITKGHIWILFLNSMFLVEAAKRFTTQFNSTNTSQNHTSNIWMVRPIIFHSILFSLIILLRYLNSSAAYPQLIIQSSVIYLFLIIYGMASLTVFMAALRGIAEHQIDHNSDEVVGHAALRNFSSTPIGRWFFGAYGFSEHKTHHHFPRIPYYRLPLVTEQLIKHDTSFQAEESYFSMLYKLMKS